MSDKTAVLRRGDDSLDVHDVPEGKMVIYITHSVTPEAGDIFQVGVSHASLSKLQERAKRRVSAGVKKVVARSDHHAASFMATAGPSLCGLSRTSSGCGHDLAAPIQRSGLRRRARS